MKLKELLDKIFENGPLPTTENGRVDYEISYNLLSLIKDKLLECDEFKETNSLTIMETPIQNNVSSHTAKLTDGNIFKGNVQIYSISLTPVIYEPENWMNPVKDGCTITPTMYNPETFEPYKKIILNVDVENMVDNFEKGRVKLHEILDKMLDNPMGYSSKGTRGILIRGIF